MYGQQQQYPPAPQAPWGAVPPGYGPPGTVLGVPLEPGERVLWFRKHDYTTEKIILIVFGVLTLIILIGVIFLVMAFTLEGRSPRAHALTNRRLLVFGPGNFAPAVYPLMYITNLTPRRRRSRGGGGGLVGLAVRVAVTAALNHAADQAHKLTPAYWSRTEGIDILFSNGRTAVVNCSTSYGPLLGLLLARASLNREADMLPPAPAYMP